MSDNTIDNTLNSMIIFSSIDEKIEKLKQWKLLSPKAKELKDLYYKNEIGAYKCEILGYLSKKTNPNCIDRFYETVVIKVTDRIIRICPAYLLEMQKKGFSVYSVVDTPID